MELLNFAKARLHMIKESGWQFLMDEVRSFYENMIFDPQIGPSLCYEKSKHTFTNVTYAHHLHLEFFYVIDLQL